MPRKATGKKPPKPENTLLTALQFVAAAQRSIGALEATHCRMFAGNVFASNSILSAGHSITEDVACAPHTAKLIDALEQAPGAVSLTLDGEALRVRSGDFLASIPVTDPNGLPTVTPDAAAWLCDDRLKAALASVGSLALEGHEKLVMSSVQLRSRSVLATNGNVIMECWHGIVMPPLVIIPKAFVTALGKAKKPIARFGVSESGFTVWFDETTWLKCQTYPNTSELPNLTQYLDVLTQPVPVPKGFFEVVRRLEPFATEDIITFTDNEAKVTYATEATRKDFPSNISFSVKALLAIMPHAKQFHFNAIPGTTIFYGDNLRGAINNK